MNFKGMVMSNELVVIVVVKCILMGGFNGNLFLFVVIKFGEVVIKVVCEEMDVFVIDEVIMGCVLFVGFG